MPGDADTISSEAPAAAAADVVPLDTALTPNEQLLASKLAPEQAKVFRESRKDAKKKAGEAKPANKDAPLIETEVVPDAKKEAKGAAAADTANKGGEEIRFGDDAEATADGETPALPDGEEGGLSDEDLAKLDDKARKAVSDASKENVKVRKRAQEAEAKLKEHEARLAEREQELAAFKENQTRGVALTGNAFQQFKDPTAVAAWGTNAQEAVVLLRAQQRNVENKRAHADDVITHTLPNGQDVELKVADLPVYEARATDAQHWFEAEEKITANKETANKLAAKHASTKGYAEARDKYLKDPHLSTRIEELTAKAALYDILNDRKAVITFSDTAGAASNAPSSPAGKNPEPPAKTRQQPPSESPASIPRLVNTTDADSELKSRKSALMESAKKTDDPALRQKLLKEAIMLGNPAAIRKK